jgi:hypothetical protein
MNGEGIVVQRVFVVWTNPLFHESVRLILRHPNIQFVGANSDYTVAQKEIYILRPDTILIEETGIKETSDVMEVLGICPWNVLVVLLSLSENKFNVYHHEQRNLEQDSDLLQLILGNR